MAEIFVNQVITDAGYSLIAAATSSNPIVYVKAYSAPSVPSDPTSIGSYNGTEGTIDAASATNNTARVVAAFGPALYDPQPVKAIAISARLASQSDSVIFAYCADPDSQIVLPVGVQQTTRFAFNITIDSAPTIPTVQSGDVTFGDLERFVSCHKAGQPTAGENQTIYGVKDFQNAVEFQNQVSFHEDASFSMGITCYTLDVSLIESDLLPDVGHNVCSLGDDNHKWESLHVKDIDSRTVHAESVGTQAQHVGEIHADDLYGDYFHGVFQGTLEGTLEGTIPIPSYNSQTGLEIPVGSVFLGAIKKNEAGDLSMNTGQVYTRHPEDVGDVGSFTLYVARMMAFSSAVENLREVPPGSYRSLCDITWLGPQAGYYTLSLWIRVA